MTELATLEAIGEGVRERVTTLLERPELPGKREAPTTIVAGITVVDKQQSDSELGNFIERMKQYQKDAATLQQKLNKAGVTFLAIMPATMWNGLCEEAGLYRFTPDADGRVGADGSILDNIENESMHTLGMRPLRALGVGGLIGGASGAAIAVATSLSLGWVIASAVAGALAISYVSGSVSETSNFEKRKPRPDKLAKVEASLLATKLASHQTTLDALWPERVEGRDIRVKISVPAAPGDVQENLFRAAKAGLHLSLAVVGEAISFDESPRQLLLEKRGERYEEIGREIQAIKDDEERRLAAEARRREMMRNDPIVTTSHGLATAAIIQYGDFPIEQEVIERALAEIRI